MLNPQLANRFIRNGRIIRNGIRKAPRNVRLHRINCSDIPSIQDKYSSNNFEKNDEDMVEGETLRNKYIFNFKTDVNNCDANYFLDECSPNFELIRKAICTSSSEILIPKKDESCSHEKIIISEKIPTDLNEVDRGCQEESQTELWQKIEHSIDSDGGCQVSELRNCD